MMEIKLSVKHSQTYLYGKRLIVPVILGGIFLKINSKLNIISAFVSDGTAVKILKQNKKIW